MKKEQRAVRAKKHIKIAPGRSWSKVEEILSNIFQWRTQDADNSP